MFSKTRINEGGTPVDGEAKQANPADKPAAPAPAQRPAAADPVPGKPKTKAPTSLISSDLTITGNMKTSGDVQVEGIIEGDIRAHLLTVGEGATIRGEVVADDVVVDGRVIGRVRGLKVRLTSTARVEGDIIHKTIAIESGAHFEGSVQRQDDPLNTNSGGQAPVPLGAAAAEAKKA
ncbi:polymer-forming cytoskeletal protein [Alphaproteobacteria bacterium KMM 3653]|uniref:Polymer-forming cytoskeletal protein n=1 Tax=Harenicola maris TaxID=2841044 RepID=A0AAP2CMV8_9RHOB|nr:polymer-forming cytoskeletal protein [Harenicola maris]